MDDLETKISRAFGGVGPSDFFDSISPFLKQSENAEPPEVWAGIASTAEFLRVIVKTLRKFDLGQERVQKAKLQRSEDLLQAALHGAFVLGLITAAQPDAAKYRNDYLSKYFVKKAAEARASDQPRRDQVTSIVREETEAYWAQFPSSKLSDNAIAGRIMDRVNERLLAAMKGGLARIDNLTQNAIAKRIKALKLRTLEQASDQKTDG